LISIIDEHLVDSLVRRVRHANGWDMRLIEIARANRDSSRPIWSPDVLGSAFVPPG
jgi:hypothetical protein